MTRDELIRRIYKALFDAMGNSPEFLAAVDELPGVGLQRDINVVLSFFTDRPRTEPATIAANDAAWLRSLRIDPNDPELEGRN